MKRLKDFLKLSLNVKYQSSQRCVDKRMNKKKGITVNGKVKQLPAHLLKKNKYGQKKKKKNKKGNHVKSSTFAMGNNAQLIAKQNMNATQEHADDYVSSDTSAEWFDGDEDSDSKAYAVGGYLRVRIGDKLNSRYVIQSKLGWGHFSTVWLSIDLLRYSSPYILAHTTNQLHTTNIHINRLAPQRSSRRFVALKIQKSAAHYLDAAKDEVQLLNAAKIKKQHTENYIVQMLDSFIVSTSNGKR